jgi:DNA gyrase subunit B
MSTNPIPTDAVEVPPADVVTGDYTGEQVNVLRDAAHIRQRPGMYIGNTSTSGLHQLVYELVHNSIDEALAGFCKNIAVRIHVDGSCTVEDDGRGIPVDEHPTEKRPTLEVVLTKVGAGAKFENNAYKVSAGLHGMGAKAVTALSEWTEARVRRNSRTYMQQYERGYATTEVSDIGASTHTGTSITFRPDPQIFHDASFVFGDLEDRIRELAFLNKNVNIHLLDERTGQESKFCFAGGITEFVTYLNEGEEAEHKPIYIFKKVDDIQVEVALQYTRSEDERVRCYANNTYNPVGGTHLTGFRSALTRTLGAYAEKEKLFREDLKVIGEDYREGLTAVVSVQLANPHFESQTKVRLNNPEVESAVASVVSEFMAQYLEEHPKEAKKLLNKVILAAEARVAAAKAKQALRDRKSILSGGGLPGKLMDCTTRDRDASELFLVEGNSAGGSADNGRNREFQAVLPLRGKVLNVEKSRLEKLLGNEEIVNLISAIGVDIGNTEDVTKLRYGRIIILTDADVDGQHIRTLLLTFFFRQMRKLIEDGRVFVARPPLYKVVQKKNVRYVQSIPEMQRELTQRGLDGTALHIMHPDKAPRIVAGDDLGRLVQVLSDLENLLVILERRGLNLSTYLARAGAAGLPVYHVLVGGKEHWFHTNAEVDAFRKQEQTRLGRDLVVADDVMAGVAPEKPNGDSQAVTFILQELHEVRGVNRHLDRLREVGLGTTDLIPLPRVAGREPPIRFVIEHGSSKRAMDTLRDLPSEVRRIGEHGLNVVRFKGLGEMDGEELWETTLDPEHRNVLRVTLEDALKADHLFRVLMGEKVEPRRDFITKHAQEVKEIDYHGA